jgi:hypothetical protein
MTDVLELARECGALAFRDSGGKLLLCGEAQLTAFAARIREEATKEREAMAAVCKAAKEAEELLTNLQPHIPQACYPGRAVFIDNYVDPALDALRSAIEALDSMQKEGAKL